MTSAPASVTNLPPMIVTEPWAYCTKACSTSVSDGAVGLAGSAGFAASSACAPRAPRAKIHSSAPARAKRKRSRSRTSSNRSGKSRATGICMRELHKRVVARSGGLRPWTAETLRTHGGALLDVLAVQRYVQPLAFLFLVDAQANGHIDDLEDRVADDEAVNHGRHYGFRLREDASGLTAIERRAGKNTREQCTDNPADAVHAERIERIVVTKRLLKRCRGEEADDPSGHADDDCRRRHHEPGSRRDGHQSGDRAGGYAEHTRFALDGPFHEHPGQRCRGGGDLRDGHRHTGAAVGGHCGTGIETKPAAPEERGA